MPTQNWPGTVTSPTGIGIGGTAAPAGGIAFPASAVAVADANTLDDYEEGTWTPTLNGFTLVGSAPNSAGRYTKVGNLVYVECTILGGTAGNTSHASVAGSSNISGLPFAPANVAPCAAGNGDGIGYGTGVAYTSSALYTPVWAAYVGNVYISATYRV